MKKWIIRISIAVAVLVILAIAGVFLFINSIVKSGVEAVGPKLTKVDMRLDSAKISPFSGSGQLSGFFMGNPEGFKTPSSVKVGNVKVAVNVSSLLSDVIQVEEINIQAPEITLEASLAGSNLGKILDNLKASASATPQAGEKPADKSAGTKKNIYIKDVVVNGGKINFSVTALGGKSATVPLPPLHLQEIGTRDKGVTMAEASKQIMDAIVSCATKAASTGAADVTKGVKDIGSGAKEEAGKAIDGIKGIFKK